MKQISENHRVCTAVGTTDNQVEQEMQTEKCETDDSWTQNAESAKTKSTARNAEIENFVLMPESPLASASKIAQILLDEIDQEKIDAKLTLPQTSIKNVFENVHDISTDWERIAIATKEKIFIYHLSDLSKPCYEIEIRARVSLLTDNYILIGTGHGSLAYFSFLSSSISFMYG